jgi:two-component system, NtrC family, nitrogen regulation response regulator NtrX
MSEHKKLIKGSKILVVDDHRNIRFSLKLALEHEGAEVDESEDCLQAKEKIKQAMKDGDCEYQMFFLDIRLPDGSGLDLLKMIAEAGFSSRAVMISGEGTINEAFQATQLGAFDYIEKPFIPERILVSVQRCLDFNKIKIKNDELNRQILKGHEILGNSAAIATMVAMMQRVAGTNSRVLILGESGTGKELVAGNLHRLSDRSDCEMIKVNCAAIPHSLIESELFGHEKGAFTDAVKTRKGMFELAHGGCLFLDEIGELSLDVQAKLLRALENGEIVRLGGEKVLKVDVRVFAATHCDLEQMVKDGQFREDLYYRLNVLTIEVPPLRDRGEDIKLLAEYFLDAACTEHSLGRRSFGAEIDEELQAYHWPGNIRELKNCVERASILAEGIEIVSLGDLSREDRRHGEEASQQVSGEELSIKAEGDEFVFQCEAVSWQHFHELIDRDYIKYILGRTGGNVSESSRVLSLERAYLHRLMKKLGIQRGVVVSDEV